MTYTYDYDDSINLYVKGRISLADAKRQKITASVILQRLARIFHEKLKNDKNPLKNLPIIILQAG